MMNTGMVSPVSSYSDSTLLDSYISYRRRFDLLQGEADVDLDSYASKIAAYQDEYVNRGNSLEMLSSDAAVRVTSLMSSDVADLTDEEVNLRILCDQTNVDRAKLAAAALNQNPDDIEASNAAAGGREALEANVSIRSVEDVPKEENQGVSPVWSFVDQTVMTVGQSWLLSKVTSLFGGSGIVSTLVGVGGRQLLNGVGILPNSIAPILEMVKPLLPKSAQAGVDHVIDALQPKTEEQLEEERFDRYSTLAIGDSMAESVDGMGKYTTESIAEAMYLNGEVIGSNGVMSNVGETGLESAENVREMVVLSTTAAETGFDERIAAGEDCSEDMRYYYMSLFAGLDGYNQGVVNGVYSTYGEGDPAIESAGIGLGYVNNQYCVPAIASLRRYDAQYHFMTEEDWATLDSYDFIGVGPLSTYDPEAAAEVETEEPSAEELSGEQTEDAPGVEHEEVQEDPSTKSPEISSEERPEKLPESGDDLQAEQESGSPVTDAMKKRLERLKMAQEMQDRVVDTESGTKMNLDVQK